MNKLGAYWGFALGLALFVLIGLLPVVIALQVTLFVMAIFTRLPLIVAISPAVVFMASTAVTLVAMYILTGGAHE